MDVLRSNPCRLVGGGGSPARRGRAPRIAESGGDNRRPDAHRVQTPSLCGLARHEHQRRSPVADGRTHQQVQRINDLAAPQHLLHRHLLAELRFGIQRRGTVALDGDAREIFLGRAARAHELPCVPGIDVHEDSPVGRTPPALLHLLQLGQIGPRAHDLERKALIGMRELFRADHQCDVALPAGDLQPRQMEGCRARSTSILDIDHGLTEQSCAAQRRLCPNAFLPGHQPPGCIGIGDEPDIGAFDGRVGQRLRHGSLGKLPRTAIDKVSEWRHPDACNYNRSHESSLWSRVNVI